MTAHSAQRYLSGELSPRELLSFETTLAAEPSHLSTIAEAADTARLAHSRMAVFAEIDTPRASRTERFVQRLGLSEPTARLVAATPAFRRSFGIAIIAMMFFTAATANSGEGANRLLTFLTLAPALPLLGTALAFGPSSDPMHEVTIVTPMHGVRIVLIRTFAVYVTCLVVLIPGSVIITEIGPWRWAWLMPGLALTTTALALSTRLAPQIATATVGVSWLCLVTVFSLSSSDDVAMFRPAGQLAFLFVSALAATALVLRRDAFDAVGPS